ncbi:MAG: amino acid--tRNA ligase-related protein, partial [Pontimonas sp.]
MNDAPQIEPDAEDIDEQHAVRLGKREQMLESGVEPFPVSVPVTTTISAVRRAHPDLEPEATTGEVVGVAGRVVHMRVTGKLAFLSLQEGSGERLQAMVSFAEVGEESFELLKDLVDLGDHVFVSGEVIASKRGELSVMVAQWQIASKAVMPLPNLHSELNEETRVRQRYLDLIVREQARTTVRARAAVNASLRATFAEHDYLEVETPMLQVQHGGASARPFVTHSNAFSTDLFLRIAPELYLKRAVVGGIERVFEINRNFRNEGADSTHSPEFAMLEAYQAYGDYHQMADLTQELIQKAALAVAGSTTVTWADGTEYDLGGQWDRLSVYESLSDASGTTITPDTSVADLETMAKKLDIEVAQPTHGKYVEELWEHFVKESLSKPTFVMD